jgi:hypothetical protein
VSRLCELVVLGNEAGRFCVETVAVGGDGLQIWRVAANILNKHSRTDDSGWSSSLGVERGLTNLPCKSQYLLRNTTCLTKA